MDPDQQITVIYGPPATGKTNYLTMKAHSLLGDHKKVIEQRIVLPVGTDLWIRRLKEHLKEHEFLFLDEFNADFNDWIILFGELLKFEEKEMHIVTNQSPPPFLYQLDNTQIIRTRRGQNPIIEDLVTEN